MRHSGAVIYISQPLPFLDSFQAWKTNEGADNSWASQSFFYSLQGKYDKVEQCATTGEGPDARPRRNQLNYFPAARIFAPLTFVLDIASSQRTRLGTRQTPALSVYDAEDRAHGLNDEGVLGGWRSHFPCRFTVLVRGLNNIFRLSQNIPN